MDEKKPLRSQQESSAPRRKPKHLILCFDGTANQFDETNTNIVHLFALLEKENPDQLVYYQTGVGTYVSPSVITPIGRYISKCMDIAVGWYLDAHVIDGYQFLQSNYEKGDKICLFGFSRGAYTARALAGMLYTIGLLPKSMPEQVEFAYRVFKSGKATATYKRAFCRPVKIEFIGVFDTVSSVGAIWPRVLPFSVDNKITKTFRHALALDERRAKFRSNGWRMIDPDTFNEPGELGEKVDVWDRLAFWRGKKSVEAEILAEEKEAMEEDGEVEVERPTDVKEVWFAGSHCDVGGGNALDIEPYKLSNVALRWMVKEVILNTDIKFDTRKLVKLGVPLPGPTGNAQIDKAIIGTQPLKPKLPHVERGGTRKGVKKEEKRIQKLTSIRSAAAAAVGGTSGPQANLKTPATENVESPVQTTESVAMSPSPTNVEEANASTEGAGASSGGEKQRVSVQTDGASDGTLQDPTSQNGDAAGADPEHPDAAQPWWYRDVIQPLRDELLHQPGWWPLEVLPFYITRQNEHGHLQKILRVNTGRPRIIPKPPHESNPSHHEHEHEHAVKLPPNTLFHKSVLTRMEAPEARERTWRSFWLKKDKAYFPRAWPKHGEPIYVD